MEAPKPKEQQGTPTWGKFFRTEFENLKLKTSILQNEKLSTEERDILIGLMVQECKVKPYDEIDKIVIQRVISAAVIDDKDFIGFSVKWIRKTLNAWWHISGFKAYEKIQREKQAKEELEKEVPKLNPHEDIQVTVQNYIKSLLAPSKDKTGMQAVKKLTEKEIQQEGKEWTSELERKAASAGFNIDHEKNYQVHLQHMIHFVTNEGYAHLTQVQKVDFRVFVVEGIYKVNCATILDSELIYTEAKDRLDSIYLKAKQEMNPGS